MIKSFGGILMGALALLLLSWPACTDPILVGSELFEDDEAAVGFSDTLAVLSRTVRGDSVRTFSPFISEQLRSYRCGRFDDPVFGITAASLYAQPRMSRLQPDFRDAELDSVILVLPYDTTGFYGSIDESFTLEVFRVTEDMPREAYYSNQTFTISDQPIGSVTFTPTLDSLEVTEFDDGERDTIRFPHVRIPLDLAIGEELLGYDTTITKNDSIFLQNFKGLYIRATSSNLGLLSFNLITSEQAGINLYYEERDLDLEQYKFQFTAPSVRLIHYENDYSGSIVEPYLNSTAASDSLVFIQGLAGTNVCLEIPNLEALGDVVVNNAELEISLARLPGDNPDFFGGVEQILLYTDDADLGLVPIADLGIVESRGLPLDLSFGGIPLDLGDGPDVYRFNITVHLQRILEGEDTNKLFLLAGKRGNELSGAAPLKAARAWRSVLYGGNHPQYPVKLKVAFTRL